MKKNLKYLIISSLCLFLGGILNVKADADCGVGLCTNMIFDPAVQCLKKDDSFFQDEHFTNLVPSVQYVYNGTKVEYCDNPNNPIRNSIPQCELEGWYLDSALTQKVTASTVGDIAKISIDTDANGCVTSYNYITNLYAKCKTPVVDVCTDAASPVYTLTYVMNNGEGNKTASINVNINQTLLQPVTNGYTFDGWYTDASLTNKLNTNVTSGLSTTKVFDSNNCHVGYDNITLYAKWTKIPDTCTNTIDTTFDLTYIIDSTESKKVTLTVNKIEDLLIPTKDGYTFDGWYSDSSLQNKIGDTKTSALNIKQVFDVNACLTGYEDVTIYAKWTKINEPIIEEVTNPDTGDNIIIYCVCGLILIVGCGLVIKKLSSK